MDPSGHFACWDDNSGDIGCEGKKFSYYGVIDKVPLIAQPNSTSCGEASFTMAWNYQHPDQQLDVNDVITQAIALDLYKPNEWPFTSPVDLASLANYYAKTNNVDTPYSGNFPADLDESSIKSQLEAVINSGTPLIVDVTVAMGTPNSYSTHFVVITRIDGDTVYYNDPYGQNSDGSHNAKSTSASWGNFWTSFSTNLDPGGQLFIIQVK